MVIFSDWWTLVLDGCRPLNREIRGRILFFASKICVGGSQKLEVASYIYVTRGPSNRVPPVSRVVTRFVNIHVAVVQMLALGMPPRKVYRLRGAEYAS